MSVHSRSQRDYALGIELVGAVLREPDGVRRIYGGLCHEFPVMVHSSGLAQAAAYHHAKAAGGDGDRATAHALLLAHMAAVLGVDDLAEYSRTVPTTEYMRATQRLLAGAVFFKRLAVSMLGATPDSAESQ